MKRAQLQYVLLVLLFVPTAICEWQAFDYGVLRLLHPDRVVVLPLFPRIASPQIREVDSRAYDAGVRVAVSSRPYTGTAILGEELTRRHAGDILPVTVRGPQPGSPDRNVTIPLVARGGGLHGGLSLGLKLALAVLFILIPVMCTALGFVVAAVRPRDPLAWLVLAVLLSFAAVIGVESALLPAWVRSLVTVYRTVAGQTWPLWMFLFGHYFPSPPAYDRTRWWKWLMRFAVAVVLIETALGVAINVGDLNNYRSVARLNDIITPLDRPSAILFYCLVGYFFASLSTKGFTSTSSDNKRRLRLLYWGATVSLTPCFILSVIAFVRNSSSSFEGIAPLWVVLPAYCLLQLFPLTLAYVIVVHRALDVRVVVRQGLKYALAKNSVRILQVLPAVLTALLVAYDPGRNRLQHITLIALAGLIAVLVSRGARRLKLWLDRRFFRDAYNTEQVLSELSDEVEKLNREVVIAREVQERLFPQKVPQIAGLDCSGSCRPALGVAGDYYDFLALPQGKLGVAVGDVSGKGIAAALLMASLQASLRSQAAGVGDDLAGLIRNVNRLVYEASASNRYATFFYAVYNPADRKLTYVNAGHNPPMLFRKNGGSYDVLRLEAGGTVVGLLEDFPYQQETVALVAGDILVAFTDGVSEALNLQEEEFGESRMVDAVKGSHAARDSTDSPHS